MEKNNAIFLERAWIVWRECLNGEDKNSVFQQIYIMVWDAAIFRFILESRQIQIQKNPSDPHLSSNLHTFIDRNFFQAQSASIRRLADDSNYGLTGKKSIYSLYSLIRDMNERRLDLTRTSFFRLRGIPYDYSELQRRESEFVTQQIHDNKSNGFWIPSEFNWEKSAEAHLTFDRLSGTSAKDRSPDDVVAEKVFARLEARLHNCQEIIQYVNKYVAHSATPESRAYKNIKSSQITLKHIWDAHRVLYEIAEYLSLVLYSESHFPLAWKSPNLFDNWNVPLLEHEDIDRLEGVYEQYWKETDKWRLEGIENLWKWVES